MRNRCKLQTVDGRRKRAAMRNRCKLLTVDGRRKLRSDFRFDYVKIVFTLLFTLLKNEPENKDDITFFRDVGIFLIHRHVSKGE